MCISSDTYINGRNLDLKIIRSLSYSQRSAFYKRKEPYVKASWIRYLCSAILDKMLEEKKRCFGCVIFYTHKQQEEQWREIWFADTK